MYKKKNLFKFINIIATPKEFFPNLHLTLDEYKDFVLIKKIIQYSQLIKKDLNCSEIIELVKKKNWHKINDKINRLKHREYIYKE